MIVVRGATFYSCCRRWTIKGCIWQVCIGWDYEENGHHNKQFDEFDHDIERWMEGCCGGGRGIKDIENV